MDVQLLKNFTHQGLAHAISLFRFPEECASKKLRMLGFRFLLQYRHMDTKLAPSKEQIIKQIKQMVDDHYAKGTMEANGVLMELVDILNDYSPTDGAELMAYLREQRLTANNVGAGTHDTGPECTVYGDSQSTHNQAISDSVRNAAKYLVTNFSRKFPNTAEGKKDYINYKQSMRDFLIQQYGEKFEPVVDRIWIDNSIHVTVGHTVDEVLLALLNWMDIEAKRYSKDPDKREKNIKFPVKEVLKRLGEELMEMENYCSSRLLSGVINSIQGYTDGDTNLELRISDREQVKSVVYNHLNKAIQDSGDEKLLEEMVDEGDRFVTFVKNEVAKNIDKWYEEYGDDFIAHVMSVVNEYTTKMTYE
jgi:hypothetical protein